MIMSVVAALLLACVLQPGESARGVLVVAAVVLTGMYCRRLSKSFAVGIAISYTVVSGLLLFFFGMIAGVCHSEFTLSAPLFMTLIPFLVFIVLASAVLSSDKFKGTVVFAILGLTLGRLLVFVTPPVESIGLIYLSEARSAFVMPVLVPLFVGALVGLDVGAYAENHPGLWRNKKLWAVAGLIAAAGISFNLWDALSGSYKSYAVPELARTGRIDVLVRKIDTGASSTERADAIRAIGKKGGPEVTAALIRRLNDADPWVRLNAAEYLQYHLSATATPALLRALRDKDEEVRKQAGHTLALLQDPKSFHGLIDCLDEPDFRLAAIEPLGKLGNKAAVPHLVRLFDSDEDTAYAAIMAVRELKDKRALPHFVRVVKQDRVELWHYAAKGAIALGGKEQVIQALNAHTHDKLARNREKANFLLGGGL